MLKSGGNFSGDARYEGFCIDLLKEIARIVGFAYRIELVPDGKYGVYDYETGEWNGIVRQLMDKVSGWDTACVRVCADSGSELAAIREKPRPLASWCVSLVDNRVTRISARLSVVPSVSVIDHRRHARERWNGH